MKEIKKVIKTTAINLIRREVQKQQNSACFLLGYQPKFPNNARKENNARMLQ